MQTGATEPSAYVDLSPSEFALLLGLTASDAPDLATAPVRLPAAWVNDWRARVGARELNIADLTIVLGVSERSARRYLASKGSPRLRYRIGVAGGRRGKLVSPANLIIFLRERNRLAGAAPEIRETPDQRAQRGKDAQARAAALCGD